jgi:hypothetical protein
MEKSGFGIRGKKMEDFNPSSRRKEKEKKNTEDSNKAFADMMKEMGQLNILMDNMFTFAQEVDSCPNCNPSYDSQTKKLSGLCSKHSKLQQTLGL